MIGTPAVEARSHAETPRRARLDTFAVWPAAGAALLLGLFLVLMLATGIELGNIHTGDTDNLVAGARVASECIDRGVFFECGYHPGEPWSDVFGFPLLQYIPSIVLVRLGVPDPHIVSWLARINTAAFIGSLGCVVALCRSVRTMRVWTPELLILMFSGPLAFYALAGFGEMTAAFACLVFVAAAVMRRPVLTAVTLTVACLGKETLAPFLLLLGWVCARDPDGGWLPARRMVLGLAGGVVAGLGLTVGFNLFRFGSPGNRFYLQEGFRTPGAGRIADFFAELWFAPAGGLLWFWFSAFVLFVVVGGIGLGQLWRRPRAWRGWLPHAAVLAVVVGFLLGLAAWAYPFGWIAWGPRLTVPIVPAAAVAALYAGGPALRRAIDRTLRPLLATVLVGAVLVVSTLPQAGAVWAYGKATSALLAADETCPGLQQLPLTYEDPDLYFRCVQHIAWRWSPSPLHGPIDIDRGAGQLGQIALAGGIALLVLLARVRAVVRLERPATESATAP